MLFQRVYTQTVHTHKLQTPDRQIYCFWLTVDPFPAEYISAKFHYSFNNRILSANIIRHYLCTPGTRNNFDDWEMVGASYLLVGRCQVWNVIVFCDHVQSGDWECIAALELYRLAVCGGVAGGGGWC